LKKFHQNFIKNRASRGFFAFGLRGFLALLKSKIARSAILIKFLPRFFQKAGGVWGEAPTEIKL